jgi:hypothetical protein
MRFALTACTVALTLTAALSVSAQTPCPPDGWFCDETEAAPEAAPSEGAPPAPEAAPPPAPGTKPPPNRSRPPIVVYSPEREREEEGEGTLLERKQRLQPHWGLNLRLQGVLMSHPEGRDDTGMGGIGASLRYHPVPAVALDFGADLLGGTDYNGFDRGELMWSASALFFFNPKSPLQVYSILGLNLSFAEVKVPYDDGSIDEQDWNYFGGHMGLGLQAALGPKVALNGDLTGFLRGRTDSRARREPEFIDSRGRMTNTSGGGLLRAGLTFFW